MANVVKLKRSAVSGKTPTISDLELGEVALNTHDGNLFFKKDFGQEAIVSVATTDGAQTLTNKSFGDDLSISGSLTVGDSNSAGDVTIVGNVSIGGTTTFSGDIDLSNVAIIDDQDSDGINNYILTSTGSGVRWRANTAGNISGLGDVALAGLTSGQILKYNGTVWVNSNEQEAVSSAIFAANASSDLGLVTDLVIDASEDLEPNDPISDNGLGDTDAYYNMGSIAIDGVVGLRNVDQSLKSDYISYSIIFGF